MTDRNPYVILGLPFGASKDEASAAFATRARGLRRAANGTERLKDLTWALNQVEDVLRNPRLALHVFRVPADRRPFEPIGPGLLAPPPERLPRKTGSSTADFDQLMADARAEARLAFITELASQASLPPR